jgi:hypothetical protein
MQKTDNSIKSDSDKDSSARYSLVTIGILIALFLDILLFIIFGHATFLVIGILLAIILIAMAPIRKKGQANLRRWGESDRYSFLVIGILIVITFDFLFFIGPGEGHWIVFIEMLGGPITGFFIPGGNTAEIVFISSVTLLGIISYSVWPRWWTKIITIISLCSWWIFGMIMVSIGG